MPNMSDQELLSIISNAESQAVIYNGEFSRINERLLKDYLQDPYGDEVADQSQVISPDVQDVVESDMPSLARVFLGSSQPVVFEPRSNNEDEIKEVEEKNKYVNYLIMNKPDSYQTLFNWMKDAEIQKNGVLKYFIEDSRKTEEVSYSGVNEDELQQIVLDLQRDQVKKIEVASSSEDEFGSFDITFKVTRGSQELKIINVPNEQFLISKNASTLDNAELVGDKVNNKTRGQLLSEGIDRELINQLPRVSVQRDNNSTLKNIRNRDTGQSVEGEEINDWANELVEITDLYVMVDYDQDGVAERRHILKSGNHILINEAFDHVPYASLSCLLMPHKAIGRSRAELTQQTQRVKTVLMRQTLDNMYAVNRPRNVLHPDVNIDDYLQMRPNGAVRLKSKTQVNPANAVVPLVVPPMMQQSLQVVQYMDSVRAQSTGTYLASQGLDADSIAKETATRFMGVQEKGDEKIELVARTMAETGWRKLYEGVAWMVSHFQDEETEIFVLGESLKVNPSGWRYEHFVSSKVGLGAGSPEKMVESMQGILGIQQQLQAAGSPMVDQVKLYNTLDDIIKGLGLKQTDKFFNDPEKPEQLLLAENEILKAQLLQTQQLLEQSQNPLAEAETIKAQARLIEAQGKSGLEAAKIAENARQFNIKTAQDAKQHQDDLVFDLTKLEVDSGVNIQGANV
jgi:hypothetical protein